MHRRLFEIRQVHGNLRQTAHSEPRALHIAEPPGRLAHGFGDFFGNADVGRIQENVVSDQRFARANYSRPRRGMQSRLAKIRPARRIRLDLFPQTLKLSAPDVFQILALRRRCRRLVQIHGHLEALPDFRAHMLRHGHTVFKRDAVDGNERHHIGRAHAGVRALMLRKVQQLRRLTHAADDRFLNRFALAHQRDDAAVVIGIHFAVEQVNVVALHGCDDGIDFGLIPAFGEIRNTFDES